MSAIWGGFPPRGVRSVLGSLGKILTSSASEDPNVAQRSEVTASAPNLVSLSRIYLSFYLLYVDLPSHNFSLVT